MRSNRDLIYVVNFQSVCSRLDHVRDVTGCGIRSRKSTFFWNIEDVSNIYIGLFSKKLRFNLEKAIYWNLEPIYIYITLGLGSVSLDIYIYPVQNIQLLFLAYLKQHFFLPLPKPHKQSLLSCDKFNHVAYVVQISNTALNACLNNLQVN